MSENKNKKKKVIHVDELVVKADKVIFENDRHFDRRPRDPWGGLFPRRVEQDVQRSEEEEENETENQQEEANEEANHEGHRRGWRWI